MPRRASSNAVVRPVMPPPTTTTSASCSPLRGGWFVAGVFATHSDGFGSETVTIGSGARRLVAGGDHLEPLHLVGAFLEPFHALACLLEGGVLVPGLPVRP